MVTLTVKPHHGWATQNAKSAIYMVVFVYYLFIILRVLAWQPQHLR